ncbi:hypothetical protein Tco_0317435 [Tanacetum coccineum]
MPNTRFGASKTREGINEQIDCRLAGALGARDAARNLEPLIGGGGEHEELSGNRVNGNNGNGRSGKVGNRNRGNGNGGNGNGGANGNSNRTKGEGKLKNPGVMVPNEKDKVERFIGGLPENIQGNVIVAEPTKLQDAIRIANNLMDQKMKGYARSAKNKRRLENNPRDNQGQQPVFKRQNIRGQNLARAYTAGNNKKKGYIGSLPYYNKCKLHHAGSCTVRCGNCKRVCHMTRDCKATITPNT